MRLLRRTPFSLFALVSTLALTSCSALENLELPPLPDAQAAPASTAAEQLESYAESLELLNEVAVKGRAPKTGYERSKFGKGWKDPDRNGCDAQNDILARDLVNVTYKSASRPCVVLSGTFDNRDPGKTIQFHRADTDQHCSRADRSRCRIVGRLAEDCYQRSGRRNPFGVRERPIEPFGFNRSVPTNASKGDKDAAS